MPTTPAKNPPGPPDQACRILGFRAAQHVVRFPDPLLYVRVGKPDYPAWHHGITTSLEQPCQHSQLGNNDVVFRIDSIFNIHFTPHLYLLALKLSVIPLLASSAIASTNDWEVITSKPDHSGDYHNLDLGSYALVGDHQKLGPRRMEYENYDWNVKNWLTMI